MQHQFYSLTDQLVSFSLGYFRVVYNCVCGAPYLTILCFWLERSRSKSVSIPVQSNTGNGKLLQTYQFTQNSIHLYIDYLKQNCMLLEETCQRKLTRGGVVFTHLKVRQLFIHQRNFNLKSCGHVYANLCGSDPQMQIN